MGRFIRGIFLGTLLLTMGFWGHAQNARVSISMQSATINSILDEIEAQTDYLFIYRKGVNVMLTKSIQAKDKPVYEVLRKLFADTGIIFTTEGNYIVLSQTDPIVKNKTVTGVVLDEDGVPLVGVVVYADRQKSYALTNTLGQFSIDLDRKNDLHFSYIGYETEEVEAAPGQKLRVEMKESLEVMKEVVKIGFGIQNKRDVTGSIASIDSKAIGKKNASNVPEVLVGMTAGVQILSVSGDPRSAGKIRIRGLASNSSSSNNPLYVLDGLIVQNLDMVNPQNIESIELFKDAASAAIYGAQAGNGVVLITTKTGSSGSGRVFYDGIMSFESLGWKPKMMNAEQYSDFLRSSGLATPGLVEENWDGNTDVDWLKVMFPGGNLRRHTVGMEGRNSNGDYYISLSMLDDDGIVYGEKDRMKDMCAQFNASCRIKDWARIGSTNSLQYRRSSKEIDSMGGADESLMAMAYGMSPMIPISYNQANMPPFMKSYLDHGYPLLRLPDGKYISTNTLSSTMINPLSHLYRYPDSIDENIAVYGTLFTDITPIRPVKFTSRLGYIISSDYESEFEEPWFIGEQEYNTEYSLSASQDLKFRYQWDNYVNVDFKLGRSHDFGFMAGMSYIEEYIRSTSGKTNKLKDYRPNFRYLDFSATDAMDMVGGGLSRQTALSYFTRLAYNYDERYYLQLSLRGDAFDTSYLSPLNRWGLFPSVSVGWIVTDEPWMANVDKSVLSLLKLRASWGINGNIGVLSNYAYATTVTVGGSEYALGTDGVLTLASYPSRLANDKLKWEEAEQFDIGLDASFFNNRLLISADCYDKRNRDLLVKVTPSYMTGQSSMYMNAGSVRNKGVEFDLAWKDSIGDLIYSVSANFSSNNNMVTELSPSITRIRGASVNNGHDCTYFQQGYPIWYMYGYVFEGVDPNTGNGIYRDINRDGKLTTSDMTMVGSANPDFLYGLSFSAEYKNFDLTVSGNGSHGNDIWFAGLQTNYLKNLPEVFYDKAWRSPGDNTAYPKFSQILTSSYLRSSACVYDGSYFRINLIQLGYTMPDRLASRIKMNRIRMFVSMDDYFTFSRYVGYDPVTAGDNANSGYGIDRGSYPTPRKLSFGVNISL